jgi:hypothetical protein
MKIEKKTTKIKQLSGETIEEIEVPTQQIIWEYSDIKTRFEFDCSNIKQQSKENWIKAEIEHFYSFQTDADILAFWLDMKYEILQLKAELAEMKNILKK